MKPKRGKFIVIDGLDGAGTTTQTKLLCENLKKIGIACHETAEPSKGKVGVLIREFLADAKKDAYELALLFAADRLDHLDREVNPALAMGLWVVSDRYRISSLAYQTLDCDEKWIAALNKHAQVPDLTIIIDIPAGVAMKRLGSRGGKRERFEKKGLLEKVRANYLKFAKRKGEGRVIVVNGTKGIENVAETILEIVRKNL